jgi:hypothetical protein
MTLVLMIAESNRLPLDTPKPARTISGSPTGRLLFWIAFIARISTVPYFFEYVQSRRPPVGRRHLHGAGAAGKSPTRSAMDSPCWI